MLGWIAGYVRRWAGIVEAHVVDLVHWGLHAVAGVVYTVFAHVRAAWHEVVAGARAVEDATRAFADSVWRMGVRIIRHVLPALARWAEGRLAAAAAVVAHDVTVIRKWVDTALRSALDAVDVLGAWVDDHVLKPLLADVAALWKAVTAWAYTAWWWVTHPDKLAGVLLWPLVTVLEASAWEAGGRLGTFVLGLIIRNTRRVAQLVEDVITAAL